MCIIGTYLIVICSIVLIPIILILNIALLIFIAYVNIIH